MRPKHKPPIQPEWQGRHRLELKTKAGEAFRDAQGQWTGCNWSTEWGQCKTDLKDVTEKQARDLSERYAAIADGEKPSDSELRQLRRAAKSLNPTGEAKFSRSQVAAALALEYEKAVGWLHRVEVDAAEAQQLASEAILFIMHAWLYRSNESFLKARPRAEELATLEDKYAPDASTWKEFRAALVEYLEPEPRAGR